MQFEQSHLYHIYNRGNNSQRIFFNRDNYLFFLDKIRKNILPYADILAWCLMPTHFHLMLHVNNVDIEFDEKMMPVSTHWVTPSHPVSKSRTLNSSIAILLRSYTRAIQKQEKRTGYLFQMQTKAICLTQIDGISSSWFQTSFGAVINISDSEKEYPQICFDYIHANPVRDGLVKCQEDWDYAGSRNGKLINRDRAKEFGLIY